MKVRNVEWIGITLGLLLAGCGAKKEAAPKPKPPEPVVVAQPEPLHHVDLSNSAGLDIVAASNTEVLVDGVSKGRGSMTVHQLASGTHEVTFVNGDGERSTLVVELGDGQYQRVQGPPGEPVETGQPAAVEYKERLIDPAEQAEPSE